MIGTGIAPAKRSAAGARYAACREACAARPRPGPRAGGTAAIDLVDRPPRSTGAFMICFGACIVAFCVVLIAFSAPGSDDRKAAVLGSLVFCPVGAALAVGGIDTLARRTALSVRDDMLSYSRRTLFKRSGFAEPLSAYACVLPESEVLGSARREMRMVINARLVHGVDDALNVAILVRELDQVGMLLDHGGERVPLEELAKSLDLPLAAMRSDGSASVRYPAELDLPLAASVMAAAGPDRPFPARSYAVSALRDGFTAERGYPAYIIPFLGFIGAGAACLFLIDDPEARGPLSMVCGAFSCFMLAFSLMRSRLSVGGGTIEVVHRVAGIPLFRQKIPYDVVEEVDLALDPASRKNGLRVSSDSTTILWAQGARDEELAWFKDAVLRAMRDYREAPRRTL